MSKKQKHHYIPEFYLRQWIGTDGNLIEFCRRHKNRVYPRPTSPGGTGYVPGLYSIPNTPSHITNVLENSFLSIADGVAAQSLRMMVEENRVPTGLEKLAWTRFMMSLWYRTPEGVAKTVRMIREWETNKQLDELRKVYEKLKKPDDPPTPEEYIDLHRERMTGTSMVQALVKVIESELVRRKIIEMQWHLGTFKGLKHQLLTSDRPIVMTNGIGSENAHLVMPLSPTHIFIAATNDQEADRLKALSVGGEFAVRLNDFVVRQARRFVFAQDRSQLRFIENRLGERAWCSPFED